MREKPEQLPVHKVGDRAWEVRIIPNAQGLLCESEDDARLVAAAPMYEYESLERTRVGSEFADELDRLATVLAKYRIGFGSRFFRRRAEEARRQS